MKKFMVVHKEPDLRWDIVENNWRKLADYKTPKWLKTYYNIEEGVRFCVWTSPNRKEMEKIFDDLKIAFESITQIEETTPDLWGKRWEEHIKAEETADTLGD